MSMIFGKPKAVTTAFSDGEVPMTIQGWESENLYIQSISGSHNPAYQTLASIGSTVYINAFRNSLSTFTLQGLDIFTETCDGSTASKKQAFTQFYLAHKITNEAAQPLVITYRKIVLKGFFGRVVLNTYTQQNVKGISFQLEFLCIPETLLADGELSI